MIMNLNNFLQHCNRGCKVRVVDITLRYKTIYSGLVADFNPRWFPCAVIVHIMTLDGRLTLYVYSNNLQKS